MLKRTERKDTAKMQNFYQYVADHTENMGKYGRWIYGQHPTDAMIEKYINNGNMYFAEEDGIIIAAAAVTFFQGKDYHSVRWNVKAEDDEVAVIHILCIHPKMQGRGLAKKIVAEIIELAKTKRKKAMRVDALCCNAPAHRLYDDMGFVRCGSQNWYASNTGYIDFYLFEYILE